MRNEELNEARAELARTAVAAERERFARDLHDLLGHSLSVIAIKAELAGRLLPAAPERGRSGGPRRRAGRPHGARARSAKRSAATASRRSTGELGGARIALSAAGIERRVRAVAGHARPRRRGGAGVGGARGRHQRDPPQRGLALSGAGAGRAVRCARWRWSMTVAGARVRLAGRFGFGSGESAGNGLAGLSERAEALRGRIEAGGAPGGGFRLAVDPVPVTRRRCAGPRDPGADRRGPGDGPGRAGQPAVARARHRGGRPRWRAATRCWRRPCAVRPDVALLDIEMPGPDRAGRGRGAARGAARRAAC